MTSAKLPDMMTVPLAAGNAELSQARQRSKAQRYQQLLARTHGLAPITVAVVHPCGAEALAGAIEAARLDLIVPILVGPETRIRAVAAAAKIDLANHRIVATPPRPWLSRWRAAVRCRH